jgi:hypothetical protein
MRTRKLRRVMRGERDFANAGVVGSGAVGVGLLLDLAALPASSYWAFVLIDGVLIAATAAFSLRALSLAKASSTIMLSAVNRLLPSLLLVIIGVGSLLQSGHEHPIQLQSSKWWQLVAGAFVLGFSFWFHRSHMDEVLEQGVEPQGSPST